ALTNRLIDKGVNGFYVCGSTGESFLLEKEERMKVLETVVEETAGRVPVIAHVGDIWADRAAELAAHAAKVGANAVSAVPPFYFKFTFDEIAEYYKIIQNAAGLPLIVYNVPVLSGVSVTSDNIGQIMASCDVEGIKFTSNDMFELSKIRAAYPDLCLLNGFDEIFINALPVGIQGAIGSTYNIMSDKFFTILNGFNAGDLDAAREMQKKANEIINILIKTDVKSGIKYLLTKTGIPCGPCRRPFAALTKEKTDMLDKVLELL
ncbi:MAG TPA: N-acetylneuraminate lyase, partial [Clostridiales bacterium]|nr:N-acetylneuraminate lyase [Clostridiales bacterium]